VKSALPGSTYQNVDAQITFYHECTDVTCSLKTTGAPPTTFTHYLLIDPILSIDPRSYFTIENPVSGVDCYTFEAFKTDTILTAITPKDYLTVLLGVV
jgi:hypothetical protein